MLLLQVLVFVSFGRNYKSASAGVSECCKWMGTRICNLKETAEFKVKLKVGRFLIKLTNIVIRDKLEVAVKLKKTRNVKNLMYRY